MPDLADRISRAAVAALDLAPFDDRFAQLSRQVLTGGASRFSKIVDERQAVSYVIPVGVAGQRIDYGALVLQPDLAGLLWRDPSGVDHHASVSVTPSTPATYSTVSLGGESWTRFSVGGASRLTFLVPPVKSRALLPTLVDFFGAESGPAPATVLPEPTPPQPAVRFPEGPVAVPAEPPHVTPAPGVRLASTPAAEQPDAGEQDASALEATQPMSAVDMTGPIPLLPHHDRPESSPAEAEPTRALPADAGPTQAFAVGPDAAQTHPNPQEGSPWAPAAPFDLFRDEPRSPSVPEPTRVLQTSPVAPDPAPARPESTWTPSARLEPVTAAAAYVQPVGSSATLRGFLIGLLITLAVGIVFILFQLIR